MADTSLPRRGLVFWPVGSGDSTTVVISDDYVLQIDIRDMVKADHADAVVAPVVDRLVEELPKDSDGRPYLAAFALTHADEDHCLGFAALLDAIHIGELWATPRLWRELEDTDAVVCEDARAFQKEVERRVEATKAAVKRGEEPVSGDRVLVIGRDTDSDDHPYADLPEKYLTGPGMTISALDGQDLSEVFEVFIHAPFKGDCDGARNDTSLALQVTLKNEDGGDGRALLLGDLAHPTISKIFEFSENHDRPERLAWDVLLAPHHCSKYVMYVDGELQQDIMDAFERHARQDARIVASSSAVPGSDQKGHNPPHAKAKARYLTILKSEDHFVCTAEWPDEDDPHPVAFGLTANGLALLPAETVERAVGESAGIGKAAQARREQGMGVLIALAAGGLAAAGAAVAVKRWSQRRATKVQAEQTAGLDRVQQAVDAARGQSTPPSRSQPVGFGRG